MQVGLRGAGGVGREVRRGGWERRTSADVFGNLDEFSSGEQVRAQLAATVHVDGTASLQFVASCKWLDQIARKLRKKTFKNRKLRPTDDKAAAAGNT